MKRKLTKTQATFSAIQSYLTLQSQTSTQPHQTPQSSTPLHNPTNTEPIKPFNRTLQCNPANPLIQNKNCKPINEMTEKWSSDLEQESIYEDKAEGVSQLTSLSAALSLSGFCFGK